jgi:hypothetical protein
MRAVDVKILKELEMLYGDKDCFASLHNWFGNAEVYWNNLKRLLKVADNTKKDKPSTVEEINLYTTQIDELFHRTKNYASKWNSKNKEKSNVSTKDYTQATNESWDRLDDWTVTQEKLRQEILEFIEVLNSIASKPYW